MVQGYVDPPRISMIKRFEHNSLDWITAKWAYLSMHIRCGCSRDFYYLTSLKSSECKSLKCVSYLILLDIARSIIIGISTALSKLIWRFNQQKTLQSWKPKVSFLSLFTSFTEIRGDPEHSNPVLLRRTCPSGESSGGSPMNGIASDFNMMDPLMQDHAFQQQLIQVRTLSFKIKLVDENQKRLADSRKAWCKVCRGAQVFTACL